MIQYSSVTFRTACSGWRCLLRSHGRGHAARQVRYTCWRRAGCCSHNPGGWGLGRAGAAPALLHRQSTLAMGKAQVEGAAVWAVVRVVGAAFLVLLLLRCCCCCSHELAAGHCTRTGCAVTDRGAVVSAAAQTEAGPALLGARGAQEAHMRC